MLWVESLLLFLLISGVEMVKRNEFKTCTQSGFCKRQRAYAQLVDLQATANATYSIVPGSIDSSKNSLSAQLMGIDPTDVYLISWDFLASGVRLKIKERAPLYPRYEEELEAYCLVPEALELFPFTVNVSDDIVIVHFGKDDSNTLTIQSNPFKFEIAVDNVPAISFNERNYFYFEDYRKRQDNERNLPRFVALTGDSKLDAIKTDFVADMWEESFNGKPDGKPKGPSSIGLDISFPGSSHVYGLPEHASSFALKSTRGPGAEYSEPYRLYNLDVFEYELDNPMALYGSVPFMMSHKKGLTTAVLWLNAAEMWVDVEKTPGTGSGFKLSNYVPFGTKKSTAATSVETHWSAESGIVDLFFFVGPTQSDIYDSFTALTGRPTLPQFFSIAYHQCRWNYNDEKDVAQVDAGFDEHDIPYDVLWLDIEHTNGKRYFTWDESKFPTPAKMQDSVAFKGRKMVTIIDPHIKRDTGFSVFKSAEDKKLFVKGTDGSTDFNGWCWPGDSSWLDYTNVEAREYWSRQFLFENYKGSTPSLYTWNDMNEPSVFTGPEITMPKDVIHHSGWEHRDIHNIYGMLQHRATYEGHLLRSDNKDRPFVLSRAFFVGTQRYGSIWTGDNMAQWDHIASSVPMLLTIGISGVVFSGADVGGFFGNPDPELLVRWYQIGALQPFFRAHAHLDSKRREPWLFGEPYTTLIRQSVRRRYRLLPYIYTLYYEASIKGTPVMRPMMLEYPEDEVTFGMDDQFMLGSAIVVKPVSQPGQTSVQVYLSKTSVWYEYDSLKKVTPNANSLLTFATPLASVPIFLKGGSIVPRRDRIRRSASLTKNDPYTLLVALDKNGEAKGSLYVDDGKSFEYQSGKYVMQSFMFANHTLTSSVEHTFEENVKMRFERIILVGIKVKSVSVGGSSLHFDNVHESVVVKNPPVFVGSPFSIDFE